MDNRKKNIAIFASGSGTNAINIIKHFSGDPSVQVKMVLTNRKKAGVINKAYEWSVKCLIFEKEQFFNSQEVLIWLEEHDIDFIVLAGFLLLVPEYLVEAFESRIINIHPALLPKYGGKGMYGKAVHQAVIDNREAKTGITVHYVNNAYDEGKIIAQYSIEIDPDKETIESLEEQLHQLEYRYYPQVIESVIKDLPKRQ